MATIKTVDLLTGERAFDAVTMLSVLTSGFYCVSILAEEAGLSQTRAAKALSLLVSYGQAEKHPVQGYRKAE
jgi:hypothetical protein